MPIYIISQTGKPLMPTERIWRVKKLLKNGLAKVIQRYPFTIQLQYKSSEYVQPVKVGMDVGYENIGFSAVSEKRELLCGTLKCLDGISERITERRMYRRTRRRNLRHRKPRFLNRKKKLDLVPSIQHKLETHIRLIEWIKKILPIQEIIIEVANFDIQKINDPAIAGAKYQNGQQTNYDNVREYILHRDHHTCQNPNCRNRAREIILQVHHIGYWENDRSDRPGNLITLCSKCHTPRNHKPGYFLHQWKPRLKSFRPETFMSTIRWRLVDALHCQYCYGYETKRKRIALGMEKTHYNDAFVIAGGNRQTRAIPVDVEQIRRNNRSLSKFYDAQYIDIRTGNKASGQELNCGRRTRNKNFNTEDLRQYRGKKLSPGEVRIRQQRYVYQPHDIVVFQAKKYIVKGIQNYGAYIKLDGLPKPVRTDLVSPYLHRKGICICLE